jgi:molybdenum cofactor cytidylyltransferase
MPIATIILAAGSSTRLGGQPKQLLRQNGTSLVRHMADLALSLQVGPVVVVLGANEGQISQELTGLPLITASNANWSEGLASSLRVGLMALPPEPLDAFLILLTDQPHVSADLLRQLIDTRQETGRSIVASRYGAGGGAGTPERAFRPAEPAHLGVPALFDSRYIPEFLQFTGDVGARKLIRQYPDDCAEVPFPLGAVDLDTPQDVAAWQSQRNE